MGAPGCRSPRLKDKARAVAKAARRAGGAVDMPIRNSKWSLTMTQDRKVSLAVN